MQKRTSTARILVSQRPSWALQAMGLLLTVLLWGCGGDGAPAVEDPQELQPPLVLPDEPADLAPPPAPEPVAVPPALPEPPPPVDPVDPVDPAVLPLPVLAPVPVPVNPSLKFVFVAGSTANLVTTYRFQNDLLGTVGAVASKATFAQPTSLAVDGSNRYLYVGHEGTSRIGMFSIGADGSLATLNHPALHLQSARILLARSGWPHLWALTNAGFARTYAVQADGRLVAQKDSPLAGSPGEAVLSDDGGMLYVSYPYEHRVDALRVAADGSLSPHSQMQLPVQLMPKQLALYEAVSRFLYIGVDAGGGAGAVIAVRVDGQGGLPAAFVPSEQSAVVLQTQPSMGLPTSLLPIERKPGSLMFTLQHTKRAYLGSVQASGALMLYANPPQESTAPSVAIGTRAVAFASSGADNHALFLTNAGNSTLTVLRYATVDGVPVLSLPRVLQAPSGISAVAQSR
ncbi:MAG: hypothetical protein MUF08_12870 [Burkholderiaceae bacterium]|jgi:hypothetical protein|nr:hypothetical protein [Burkholderiaceae bacterium]MCU0965911.1 hypothetical protein [Burkholderiaceae bacterium]